MMFHCLDYFPDDFLPSQLPPDEYRRVFADSVNSDRMLEPFRRAFVESPQFPRCKIGSGATRPIFLHGRRIGHTAGIGMWTLKEVTGDETEPIDLAAVTLLLSGIARDADEEAIAFASGIVGAEGRTLDDVRAAARPVAVSFYESLPAILETNLVATNSAMFAAFFASLGAGA